MGLAGQNTRLLLFGCWLARSKKVSRRKAPTTRSRRARARRQGSVSNMLLLLAIRMLSGRRNGVCQALALHQLRCSFGPSCSFLLRLRQQSSCWHRLLLGGGTFISAPSSCQQFTTSSGQNALNRNHHSRPRGYRLFATTEGTNENDASVDEEAETAPDESDINSKMTVREALRMVVQSLEEESIPDPVPSAVQLLALALELPWETGYRNVMQVWESTATTTTTTTTASSSQEETLTPAQTGMLEQLLQRRRQHEPLQYICGQWDFLDYTLAVRTPLLCPRPETEELVELVVKDVLQQRQQSATAQQQYSDENTPPPTFRILDIGCGTGCIGIALADRLPGPVMVTAIDVEPVAIETSQANAQRVLGADWQQRYEARLVSCEDFNIKPQQQTDKDNYYNLVVSNPPYIPEADMRELDRTVKDYESATALFGGGADGMDVIRTIVRRLPEWCAPGGTAVCWMEVDPTHPAKLRSWLEQQQQDEKSDKHLGRRVAFVRSEQDMFGRDRFVKLIVPE